jgi:Arc-like DNA binding domain
MARKPTDTVQLNLRFPEMLRRLLEREARQSKCSLNTEIIKRLERSFEYDQLRRDAEELISDFSPSEEAFATLTAEAIKSMFQRIGRRIAQTQLAAAKLQSKTKGDDK